MNNRIEAHIEFSFKGETLSLSSTIDLDQLLARYDTLPSLHALLAKEHGIDTYSYLYEVMQETEIEFKNPQGNARQLLIDGNLDHEALASNWQNLRILTLLQPIATRELGIANLDQHQTLKNALIQAYNLGKEAR